MYQPQTLCQALALLREHEDLLPVAGGTDVLIQARQGKLRGRGLLSIRDLGELRGIQLDADGNLEIGALTTFAELEKNPLIQTHIPILAQAAGSVGGPQIRAMGTVGGNLCNGATSADTASALYASDAELLLISYDSERWLPLREFHQDAGKTARQPRELLRKIRVSLASYRSMGGCYLKYSLRRAMDIAVLGCAVMVKAHRDGEHIDGIRIAFGVAAPTPLRALRAEEKLRGLSIEAAKDAIADLARAEIMPRDSWRASRLFRFHIAGELARRALAAAWSQALERRYC
jgi:xanthine dehydrogenase FAD-binding subunit